MNKETAARILSKYKRNEELNLHAENLLLLAEAFEDGNAYCEARANLAFIKMKGYANSTLSNVAHNSCNHYYYKLTELAK